MSNQHQWSSPILTKVRQEIHHDTHAVTHCHELAALIHLLPLAEWVLLVSSQTWQSGQVLDGYPSNSTRKCGGTGTLITSAGGVQQV